MFSDYWRFRPQERQKWRPRWRPWWSPEKPDSLLAPEPLDIWPEKKKKKTNWSKGSQSQDHTDPVEKKSDPKDLKASVPKDPKESFPKDPKEVAPKGPKQSAPKNLKESNFNTLEEVVDNLVTFVQVGYRNFLTAFLCIYPMYMPSTRCSTCSSSGMQTSALTVKRMQK